MSPAEHRSVLITGATSFLGRSLAHHLQDAGSVISVVVRPSSPIEHLKRLEHGVDIRVHDGSTESLVDIVEAVRPAVVVNLATRYERDHAPSDIEGLITSNVLFGTQLLEAMRLAGCTRLVTADTYFQYFESPAYRPLNLYAATKQAFDDILVYYVDAHAFNAITLVLFDIYGPADPRPKLLDALRKAQRTGVPVPLPNADLELDLVFVDDAVAAFERALDLLDAGTRSGFHRYAVSGKERHTLSQLLSIFEEVAGVPVPHEWGRFNAGPRVIERPWVGEPLPGWEPRTSLRDGIKKLLESAG